MIEPTKEMVSAAYSEIDFVYHTGESVEAAVRAVLAIVDRDYRILPCPTTETGRCLAAQNGGGDICKTYGCVYPGGAS